MKSYPTMTTVLISLCFVSSMEAEERPYLTTQSPITLFSTNDGEFNQVQKLDLERKNIIKKISNDAANLNTLNTRRLKLIWVNNKELVKKAEESISKKKEKFNKLKKTFKAYSKQ